MVVEPGMEMVCSHFSHIGEPLLVTSTHTHTPLLPLITFSTPFSSSSSSDPHSLETLDRFQDSIKWAVSGGFSQQDVAEAKLSVFSQVSNQHQWPTSAVWIDPNYSPLSWMLQCLLERGGPLLS